MADGLVGDEGDEFVKSVVESRNQVAHGLIRSGGIEGGDRLHWTYRVLTWLLRYQMIVELGFSDRGVRRRVAENSEFKAEARRLREELGLDWDDSGTTS